MTGPAHNLNCNTSLSMDILEWYMNQDVSHACQISNFVFKLRVTPMHCALAIFCMEVQHKCMHMHHIQQQQKLIVVLVLVNNLVITVAYLFYPCSLKRLLYL